jgi:hypothetical protein
LVQAFDVPAGRGEGRARRVGSDVWRDGIAALQQCMAVMRKMALRRRAWATM